MIFGLKGSVPIKKLQITKLRFPQPVAGRCTWILYTIEGRDFPWVYESFCVFYSKGCIHTVLQSPECHCLLKESRALSFVDTFCFPLLLPYRVHTNFLLIKMGDLPNMVWKVKLVLSTLQMK